MIPADLPQQVQQAKRGRFVYALLIVHERVPAQLNRQQVPGIAGPAGGRAQDQVGNVPAIP